MQDLIKQSESELEKLIGEEDESLFDNCEKLLCHSGAVKELFIKQMELAYNKGREESSSCNTLCTNRKDTYHEWNMRNNKECYCKSNTNIHMENTNGTRELTYGEKAVGLTFNPGGNPKVDEVKKLYAQIIDLCNDLRSQTGPGEKGRHLSVAITEAESAQMRAVKGITYQF